MSRPLRIEYENAWYHAMNRGAGKRLIFHKPKHYEMFLSLLQELHDRFHVEIHSYCLMPNHYHLLLHTPLANLSRAMRHINGVYTQRYNGLQKTDGPLFRGRFKAILVDSNNYLLRLSRYIHLNPVVSGLAKQAEQYKWSSYSAYIDHEKKPSWLTTKATLDQFGNRLQKQKYEAFMAEGIDKNTDDFYKKLKNLPILGSEAFVKTVSEKYLTNNPISKEITDHKKLQSLPTSNIIMQVVAEYYKTNTDDLKRSDRGNKNQARSVAIYLAYQLTGQSLQTIANDFANTSYSGVAQMHKRMKRQISENPVIAQQIAKLERGINSICKVKT